MSARRNGVDPSLRTIVIAWTVRTSVHDGRPYAADLGQRPGMRTVWEPRACTWTLSGGTGELLKAGTFCARENRSMDSASETPRTVFSYPTSTRDPLGAARRDVMIKRMHRELHAAYDRGVRGDALDELRASLQAECPS